MLIVSVRSTPPPGLALPLRAAGELTLPGDTSRFDYASLDPDAGLLFLAHLGAGVIVEVDVRSDRVVRTIGGLPAVHGVLVVPELHRVFATATAADSMVTLAESSGQVLARSPTGDYPDGLAYDPVHRTVWVTNETGGSETVIDADTGAVRATVDVGGEAGNVVYDLTARQILVAVQGRNTLDVIDPVTFGISRKMPLPGCEHSHGLAVDNRDHIAFLACDGNAALLTVDLDTWHLTDTIQVGPDPDVLAYDSGAHRLYVAAESGWVTTLNTSGKHTTLTGRALLATGAHVVTVDPHTHRSYYPIADGPTGHPVLEMYLPTHPMNHRRPPRSATRSGSSRPGPTNPS